MAAEFASSWKKGLNELKSACKDLSLDSWLAW